MKGFGEPIHYLVFRCNLTPKGLLEMKAALFELIKHDQDRIMIIDLGPEDGMVMDRVELWESNRENQRAERLSFDDLPERKRNRYKH